MKNANRKLKWVEIFEKLQKELRDGVYSHGIPLPSDGAIVRRFGVSRITAVRAMEELRKRGLVWRKRGSGTFATKVASDESGRLGLIMPSLSFGEIFPPICQALARLAQEDGYSFVFGDISAPSPAERAHEACRVARTFVEQKVAGVVLQPLAFLRGPERVTKEIIALFNEAEIPVVLVDRDIPQEAALHDFVGIDNMGAGRAVGRHLVERGAKRVAFLMRPQCASVIRDRLDGVKSVVEDACGKVSAIEVEPTDTRALKSHFARRNRPDAVVCESDYVAAQLRNTLAKFDLSVPNDVLLVGFDDVRCAISATPPLTTVHQPCADIARVTYQTLRDRMHDATLPARRVLLPAPLVVRESTARA